MYCVDIPVFKFSPCYFDAAFVQQKIWRARPSLDPSVLSWFALTSITTPPDRPVGLPSAT